MSNFDNDWKTRLDYLASLELGWCNGEGEPVPDSVIATVDEFLETCSDHPGMFGQSRPGIYPLVMEPGIQAEWESEDVEWNIDFTEDGATLWAFDPEVDFEKFIPAGPSLVDDLVVMIRRFVNEGIDL